MLDDPILEFRAALREQIGRPQESLDLIRAALVGLAEAARALAIPSEQFVILVKREWDSLLEADMERSDPPVYRRLRRSVITAAIKAYYMQ